MSSVLEKLTWDLTEGKPGSLAVHLVVGGAQGADQIAESIGRRWGWEVTVVKANWSADGKKAGYLRNAKMLEYNPHMVLAFFDSREKPSPGTSMMVKQAKEAGIKGFAYYPRR